MIDEYLMACPVLEPNITIISCYFPKNHIWFDYQTGYITKHKEDVNRNA